MVEVPLFNAILETSDAENMLSRLLLFHAFLILCIKCFPLSFVLRCSVLVAVSFLVSQEGVCNAGVRVCFSDDFEKQTLLFFGILHSILSSFTWNMEFYCMKTFPKVVLLKFTRQINDFNGSFKWLQYGWSVTWQACCISWFTSVVLRPLAARFPEILGELQELLYAAALCWMHEVFGPVFCNKICVILVFSMQNYGLGFGGLILFSKSTIRRICVLHGGSFQIFRGNFLTSALKSRYVYLRFLRSHFPTKLQLFSVLLKLVRKLDTCRLWKEAVITLLLHLFPSIWIFQLVFWSP